MSSLAADIVAQSTLEDGSSSAPALIEARAKALIVIARSATEMRAKTSSLFEIANVVVCFNHIASFIVNAIGGSGSRKHFDRATTL